MKGMIAAFVLLAPAWTAYGQTADGAQTVQVIFDEYHHSCGVEDIRYEHPYFELTYYDECIENLPEYATHYRVRIDIRLITSVEERFDHGCSITVHCSEQCFAQTEIALADGNNSSAVLADGTIWAPLDSELSAIHVAKALADLGRLYHAHD
jgi:hypothetical protein